MKWYTALAIYAVMWWLVLFMVLPWGNRAIADDDVAKGHADGAPERPRMGFKFAATTVIAGIVFGIFYWAKEAGFLAIRGG